MRDSDEQSNVRHFRTGHRYFCENGQWWFSTREGEEGPFATRAAAEAALDRYVQSIKAMQEYRLKHHEKFAADPERQADPFIWDQQIDTI